MNQKWNLNFKRTSGIVFALGVMSWVTFVICQRASLAAEVPEVSPSPTPSALPLKKKRGQVKSEKEAEGTEAPNRFGNDTGIKSRQYELDGQPLEVDTD